MKHLRRLPLFALTPLVLVIAGCAAPQEGLVPGPLFKAPDLSSDPRTQSLEALAQSERRLQVTTPPQVPKAESLSNIKAEQPRDKAGERADLTLAFDQLPLPNFVQVVFGQILKKNFSIDPALVVRTDLVTLRTGQPQTPSQVLETTRLLLKSYGVAVMELGGDAYRIVPDNNQSGFLPEIRRGRALPEVPLPMRPVFNLVELSAVKHSDVSQWLKAMFGARLNIQDDPGRNALLLSGQSAEVNAALEAIQVLDQPLMRSRGSQLISPASLGADDLARRLIEVLTAEGYAVGTGASPGNPISLVPVPASNALLVFAQDKAVLAHVVEWANKLDLLDSSNRRTGGNYFSYEVKYADAQALARTLQELMGAAQAPAAPSNAQVVIGAPKQPARVVVNPATNTLIVSTTNADDYGQLLGLMRALDKPAKSAMIEVTVAEVKVGDSDQLGIEWSGGKDVGGGASVRGGTAGGVALGTGGLTLSYLNHLGVVRAKLNALASQNKARILSTPRVMARNGEAATIQVGQEVPIITSQQTTNATTVGTGGTNTGVLQTIQYRSTGVILKVKPIIFAGRVELDVQQEVSSAASTSTGVNVSPTFSTRRVDTKVSIRDGATVALGGLISRTESKGNTGVPLLKDVPVVGQLFRTNNSSLDETELIILITPYVVENDLVADQVTQALRGQLGGWAQTAPSTLPLVEKMRETAPTPLQLAPQPAASSPSPSPSPSPSVAPLPTPEAPTVVPKAEPATPAGLPPGVKLPAGVDGGKAVTDPAILEEVRRLQESQSKAGTEQPARSNDKKSDKKPKASGASSNP
jgi:general secretion pathway protein D